MAQGLEGTYVTAEQHLARERDGEARHEYVMVDCEPSDRKPYWTETPVLVIEVISPATRAVDEREKRAAYQGLPSVREYALAEQDRAEVRVFRRQTEGWEVETLGPDGRDPAGIGRPRHRDAGPLFGGVAVARPRA